MSCGSLDDAIPVFRRCTHMALGLVFPPSCSNCQCALDVDDINPQLCDECIRSVFTPKSMACPRCGLYGVALQDGGKACGECHANSPTFDGVMSLGPYAGQLQSAVVRMKYSAGEPIAAAAGRTLGKQLLCSDLDDRPGLLTCVPKFWLKRLLTGVNSAEIIMSGLAKHAKLPMAADLLVCRRRINKQSMLSPEQRKRNVKNAWTVSKRYDIGGAHVMVVDDTMTTGATANEVSLALKRAGARRVTLAVVGRATQSQ